MSSVRVIHLSYRKFGSHSQRPFSIRTTYFRSSLACIIDKNFQDLKKSTFLVSLILDGSSSVWPSICRNRYMILDVEKCPLEETEPCSMNTTWMVSGGKPRTDPGVKSVLVQGSRNNRWSSLMSSWELVENFWRVLRPSNHGRCSTFVVTCSRIDKIKEPSRSTGATLREIEVFRHGGLWIYRNNTTPRWQGWVVRLRYI